MTETNLPAILASHKLWLDGDAEGIRANLYKADLSGADLSGADLSRASLSMADLSGADLYKADLYRADLSGANLSGANLSKADLSMADLSGADLSRADLYRANLSKVDLSGANLIVGGNRSDGYSFFLIKEPQGAVMVQAGCRYFSTADARKHWTKTRGDTRLGHESFAIVDHLEAMARIAEWL